TEQSNTDEAIIFAPQKLMVDPDAKPRIPFSELDLSEKILTTLTARGFTHATEVQAESIPAAMENKNILCSSMTGSGKTLAFLIPMFERFLKNEIHQSLILSPTREIAMQTYKNLEPLLEPLGLRAGLVIGGTDMLMQKNSLRDYPQILVATPGRLVDMLKSGLVWLNYTDYVVLDEADRMLDMGFEEELMDIHKDLPGTQQTLLYTATLMPEVLKVAEKYAKDYHRISIGKELSAAETVPHSVIVLHASEKYSALRRILKLHSGKTIVFFNTIKETIQVSEDLKREGFNEVVAIHSGKNQDQRNRAISDLREGKKRALLGTDVAARGIDIPLVELVINYDLPNNPEEYIHRIGRTGRAGYTGTAISFCAKRDEVYLDAIEKILKHPIDRETRLQFRLAESSAPRRRH
ncbi:MAG: DEAD/DEAH box helicase, partial [Spirochaetia bacterium]|nr:DEAD/DEAH box helicase [Spirochaetia bacterium]